jgi:hypothetical protein
MNYIQGEKFISLANNKSIYYFDTNEVDCFFQNYTGSSKFILISHNGDGAVVSEKIRYDGASLNKAPKTLVKWFAQNVHVNDARIESLPIGLENSKWFPEIKKIEKIKSIIHTQKQNLNLVYANFNIETNVEQRSQAYKVCQTLSYATSIFGKNGFGFDEYLYNIYNHDFVVCPPGNGEDTHRLWETLYVGSIPIVKKSINTLFYSDLPICYVDNWEQLADYNFLIEQKNILKSKTNLEMLDFDYWKNKIVQTAAAL